MFILLGLIGIALLVGWAIAMSDLKEDRARRAYTLRKLSNHPSNSLTRNISKRL